MTRPGIYFAMVLLSTCFISSRSQTLAEKIDAIIESRFSENQPGVATIVSQGEEILYRNSMGLANLETGLTIQPDDVFRIGSITKQFTAAAILQLASRQRLSLEDDVRTYLPDYLPSGPSISIAHLLCHAAGVKNYTQIEQWDKKVSQTDLSPSSILKIFQDESLLFEPGTDYHYSNLGYTLLGLIIEKISQKSYAEYLQDNLFDPLGMSHTWYQASASEEENNPIGYSRVNDGYVPATAIDMRIPFAAGGLQSNIDDLLTWHQYIFAEENQSWLKQAHEPMILPNGEPIGYGYGCQIGNIQGTPTVKHDGIINGFVSMAIYVPASKVSVVMLSNCDAHRDIEILASRIAALVMGCPYTENNITVSRSELEGRQGVYLTPSGDYKYIALQDDQLVLYDKGGIKTSLLPIDKHRFSISNSLNQLAFHQEGNNQILRLHTLNFPETWTHISDEVVSLQPIGLSEQEVGIFLGQYDMSGHFILEIIEEDGKIYGQVGPDRKEILPYDSNKFFARDMDIRLEFAQNSEGLVQTILMIQVHTMKGRKMQ